MILAFLAAITTQPGHSGDPVPIAGRCEYNDRVARFRTETVLVECDRLAIGDRGGRTWFDFQRAAWGPMLRVGGVIDGDAMIVDVVRTRVNDLNVPVHPTATFAPAMNLTATDRQLVRVAAMKQLVPVFLALIPLAAVIGACVTCP